MSQGRAPDRISLRLRRIDSPLHLDGIAFEDCYLVDCILNGVSFSEDRFFADSLAVADELIKPLHPHARRLLFTCACGIADDGGWDFCDVESSGTTVTWRLRRSDASREYHFETNSYLEAVKELDKQLNIALQDGVTLEPRSVFFPEQK